MKIELKQGERITVTFADTDGEIEVSYGENNLTVTADLPDTTGRQGVIYEEVFGPTAEFADVLREHDFPMPPRREPIDEMIQAMVPTDFADHRPLVDGEDVGGVQID